MYIRTIDVFPIGYLEPNDANSQRHVVIVRLEASDGTVGWGECVTIFREPTFAVAALLKYGLADVAKDKDPYDIETLWEAMREQVWWYGNTGGIAAFAISAVDMALWDLKGKLLKLPLYAMLGGKKQERLPVCASSHPKAVTVEEMAAELGGHIKRGYQSVKVGFGKKGHANLGIDLERDVQFVKAVRDAIGPKSGFIVDVGAKVHWDIPTAIRRVQCFSEYNLLWIEDPFPPTNPFGYQSLRAAVPGMRIATGERYFTLDAYGQLFDSNLTDVVLVDPGRAEGISGAHRVIQLAAQHNVAFDAHSWSTAINTAASIHLSLTASLPTIFELKPTESSMHHELVRNPVAQHDGWISAPEGYGLGADVIEETVHKYALAM
ncbi:MAG: mandelate racemase/muconate lactonizing enzyme family protein [Aggregatilineales bacterium]